MGRGRRSSASGTSAGGRPLALPREAVELRVSRSSGPGGQHAQKSETRVEAVLDVESADFLTPEEKTRVMERVGPVIRAVAQDERSQTRNRDLALERLADKLEVALEVEVERKPTRPKRTAVERAKERARRRQDVKRQRRERFDY